eukprot:155503_1
MFLLCLLFFMYLRSNTIINAQTAPDNKTQYLQFNETYTLAAASPNELHFIFNNTVIRNLLFEMRGGTGDGDLYVNYNERPDDGIYYCAPYHWSNNETCNFASAAVGPYYIMIHAYETFENVQLTVTFLPQNCYAQYDCNDGYMD